MFAYQHPAHAQQNSTAIFLLALATFILLYFFAPEALAGVKDLAVDQDVQNDTLATLENWWTFGANIVAVILAAGLIITILFFGGRGWSLFLIGALAAAFGDDVIKAIVASGSTP